MADRPTLVVWLPDGQHITAFTATEVLDAISSMQWSKCDRARLKRLLSRRLWTLESIYLDPQLDDEEFLAALHTAKMLRVDRVAMPGK